MRAILTSLCLKDPVWPLPKRYSEHMLMYYSFGFLEGIKEDFIVWIDSDFELHGYMGSVVEADVSIFSSGGNSRVSLKPGDIVSLYDASRLTIIKALIQ